MEGRLSHDAATGSLLTAINSLTTMVPNLVLSKHILIQSIISDKLQDDKALKDDHAVRRIRSNLLLFGSTKAPSNGAGRPKTITSPISTTLYCAVIANLKTF
jgi:hypothetical protein